MRRGRSQLVDSPTPGASKVIVWMPEPSSACSNGCHISMLPPMPMTSSNGRPSPRMAARMRIPSTSTKWMPWSPAAVVLIRCTVRGRHLPRACSVVPMESTATSGSYLTPSFEHARVADAMRPRVLTCDPDTPLVNVAQRMASEHVHAIVVLLETAAPDGDARRPWKIVTDHDVLRSAASIRGGPRARSRRARSCWPSPTRTCPTSRTA